MEVKYEDLSPIQKSILCNGCGPKALGNIRPPQFIFIASCDHHDFKYWLGCTEADRIKADYQFYEAMKLDVQNASKWKHMHYYVWAWIYYIAVRIGGSIAFHHADNQRTMEDVIVCVEKKLEKKD